MIPFDKLSLEQLYAILKLRQQVFMLEQNSLYLDLDELDQTALHFCVWRQSRLLAYTRLRGVEEKQCYKIERVVVSPEQRREGWATRLMQTVMKHIEKSNQCCKVMLSAQVSVIPFYLKWGFTPEGEVYLDGGVPHQNMKLASSERL
jgi:ElaA protein